MSQALSPSRCAVVEACAGSGKTWLLVSRMVRLLLAGAPPAELLAVTFTRKAAEEMRGRLYEWLEFLAVADDAAVLAFLGQRGLADDEARSLLPKARRLFEAVLDSVPGPMITTFHGWFLNLLARAPLAWRAPANLIEDAVLLKAEAWQTWAESLRAADKAAPAEALSGLLEWMPLASVHKLLFGFLDKRAEWWAWAAGRADPLADAVAAQQAMANLNEAREVVAEMWSEPGFPAILAEFLPMLAANGAGVKQDAERAGVLADLLEQARTESHWAGLQAIFLTAKSEPFVRKPGAALDKRLGAERAARFIELHYSLAERVLRALHQLQDQYALRLNRLALTAGSDLLAHYQALKRERDGLDFTDAEWLALQLLSDPDESAALLAKLDARWKHLLLDEFQDANPLQWHILTAWLSAYGADPERPTVFMVGDPKQSIYRFRRAEPRLFELAGSWLTQNFAAAVYRQDETRRCAPRVVAWVNALFGGLAGAYPGFAVHTAHQSGLPGWCELIVAPPREPPREGERSGLRDPLAEAPAAKPDKRAEEAVRVAQRILDIVDRLEAAGRPARFGDILVLSASRTGLEVFEDAFKTAGIPYLGSRRGGLLDTLEASDLMALLGFLVMPFDDLKLAHALKSPLFGCTDEDLMTLRDAGAGPWYERLRAWAALVDAPAQVRRADGLLAAWREAAGPLPPHDLLDRIFHEGEVEARYAAATPARLRPSVLANLRGVLELSLKLGGGRFPSLPHFLDELKSLGEDAGNDAPDEPPAATGDAVRMLTIHAAKGLEAPVVFLIKADEERRERDHSGALIDWPPEAERPAHFSLYGSGELHGHARNDLFEQERALMARENLNLLYVAMTRAQQALFVSGLEQAKDDTWLARLQPALEQAAMAGLPEMRFVDVAAHAQTGPQSNGWMAASSKLRFTRFPACAGMTMPDGIGRRRATSTPEIAFGIQVHRYLELATKGAPDEAVRADLGLDAAAFARVSAMAGAILGNPDTRRFFAAGQGRNEVAYVGADGQVRRIDRLVEYDDEVWVLDYKTGGYAEAYHEQLADYRQAMAALYPDKRIRTALLFGDGRWQEVE
ncbi:MAG: UvrD-helicase domain-containing protein [Gallionellaceae bacterium]|nr:UvrD-helicase domain-containing protein [Gallionellaceae bacterium]